MKLKNSLPSTGMHRELYPRSIVSFQLLHFSWGHSGNRMNKVDPLLFYLRWWFNVLQTFLINMSGRWISSGWTSLLASVVWILVGACLPCDEHYFHPSSREWHFWSFFLCTSYIFGSSVKKVEVETSLFTFGGTSPILPHSHKMHGISKLVHL